MSSEEHTGLDWVYSNTALIVAGLGALVGLCISMYNIVQHIVYYTLPEQQLHIVRVLFIVPLYALVSWLSMMFSENALYFESVRDVYEAFVIYCFLILILGYVGGEANCVALISLKPDLKHPFPLCCLPSMSLNIQFVRFCKQSCIQFIIVKPIMAILNIVMLATGHYHSIAYRVFSSVVYNICYTLALYGLLLFYLATKDDIRAFSPVRKFFAVKIVIFATYWQGLLVSFSPGLDGKVGDLWNDFILCLEMSVFAVVHLYSFPWWEFRTGMPSSRELISQNVKKVISFKDVARDVYHNVAPKYQTYALQSSQDGTVREHRTKTFLVGNLDDPKVHNKFMPNLSALRAKYGNDNGDKNGKFEKGFGQKKNYQQHTDEESNCGPEITETELEYDPRIVHNDTNTTNEDESTDRDSNGGGQLARASQDKKKHKPTKKRTVTPESFVGDEDDEEEEEEEEEDDIEKQQKRKKKKKNNKHQNANEQTTLPVENDDPNIGNSSSNDSIGVVNKEEDNDGDDESDD